MNTPSHNQVPTQSSDLRPLTVIDLDGTLIAGNSFTRFTLWMIRRAIRHGDASTFAKIGSVILRRKMRLCTHANAKEIIMRIADRKLDVGDYHAFAATFVPLVRPSVRAILSEARTQGHLLCLATAAPWQYAAPLAALLDMDEVLATYPPKGERGIVECRGEVKQRRVQALCNRLKLRPARTLTDHHDDLPLLIWTASSGGENILVAPTASTRMIAGAAGIPFQTLPL